MCILTDDLSAVVTRRGRIEAVVQEKRTGASIRDEVAGLLAQVPRRRWRRYRLTVAIGRGATQLRELQGLPATADARTLERVVRENVGSFFLGRPSQLDVSGVVRDANGRPWAAAFDHATVADAVAACRAARFERARAIPSVAALACVLDDGAHVYVDGDAAVEITISGSTIERVRRSDARCATEHLRLLATACAMPIQTSSVAVAYGAALSHSRPAFAWRPHQPGASASRLAALRLTSGIVAVGAAASAACVAPGVRATLASRRASEALQQFEHARHEAALIDSELARSQTLLRRIDTLLARRGRSTVLLGALSRVLPDSTAILTLRFDSAGGSFTALASHAADILTQLADVDGIVAPRIVGSLTRESVAGVQLERVTVRFDRPRATRSTRNAPVNRPAGK